MSKTAPDGMPFAEIPNNQIASVGREFRATVDFLYERIQEVSCVSPLLMMGAFGIEMFLKSLNAKCVYHQDEILKELGGYRITAEPLKKGHTLVALFDDIDAPFRAELEEAYQRQPVVSGQPTIREALAVYDSLFVDARYPFEDGRGAGGKSITGLVELLRLIADHVWSLPKRVCFPPLRRKPAGERDLPEADLDALAGELFAALDAEENARGTGN